MRLAPSAAVFAAAALLTAVPLAGAQEPRFTNAQLTRQPAGSLRATIDTLTATEDPLWIGYSVPAVPGQRSMCCGDGAGTCCTGCRLERESATISGTSTPASGPVKLEGANRVALLFRVAGHAIERVRTFSEDCELDAGGVRVAWVTDVKPPESVAFLESLVTAEANAAGTRTRVGDSAIAGLALHGDPAADAALDRLLAPTSPRAIREKIPLWLGIARGRRGFERLQALLASESSPEMRKKVVLGIAQSREPEAVDALITYARGHRDPAVRGEALFWLAQKAGAKAAARITQSIADDPDTEVKRRAVFALSQLPKDEGVPLLLQVARTHTNPAVRKQAIFWLGQSKDPRAIEFFAEILK